VTRSKRNGTWVQFDIRLRPKYWRLPVAMLLAVIAVRCGASEPERLAFRVGKVVTMDDRNRVLNNAVVLIAEGKIQTVGLADEVAVPNDYRLIERPDLWLVPGLIDPHNHSAGAMADLHDYVYLTNPGLRTVEALQPESENNKRARAGGVTTVLMLSGSGNNLSGFGTLTKLGGKSVDEMLIKVAEAYEEEVSNAVDALSSLLEPLIIVVIGIMVGTMVIAMYLPIFKMAAVI